MQKLNRLEQRLLPLLALLVVVCLLSVFIPFSNAKWMVVLGDSGSVQLATWTPTPSLTPSPTRTQHNCTYTAGYWKTHPTAWLIDALVIGGVTYTKVKAIAILQTSPRGDATYILAHQLIATKLNVLNGSDPSKIATTVKQADNWLVAHPLASNPPNPDRGVGASLATTMDEYNNGVIGPGHCGELESTPIPTPTPTLASTGTTLGAENRPMGFREQVSGKERFGVRGEICVTNNGARTTENLKMVDQVQYKDDSGKFQNLVGASKTITSTSQLKPGEKKCFLYEIEVKPTSGAIYRNAASVTITNHSGWMPGDKNCPGKTYCPFGPQSKADFALPGTIVTVLMPTPVATPSPTATTTSIPTSTFTPSRKTPPSPIATKISTPTSTFTPSRKATPSLTASKTNTPTSTFTPSRKATPSLTASKTNAPTSTFTPSPKVASPIATKISTPTLTFTLNPRAIPSPTATKSVR